MRSLLVEDLVASPACLLAVRQKKCKRQKKGKRNAKEMCYRKMIMSYFCKVEMSYSGNATLLLFQRRQDGGRGHHHGAPKGTEAAACDPQGDGRNAYTKGCSRAYLVDREADPSHREADTPRRG